MCARERGLIRNFRRSLLFRLPLSFSLIPRSVPLEGRTETDLSRTAKMKKRELFFWKNKKKKSVTMQFKPVREITTSEAFLLPRKTASSGYLHVVKFSLFFLRVYGLGPILKGPPSALSRLYSDLFLILSFFSLSLQALNAAL